MLEKVEQAYREFCRERFSPTSEKRIIDLEQKIGVRLPDEYRHYLLSYNGGAFNDPIMPVAEDGCPEDCLDVMFGIVEDPIGCNLASPGNLNLFDDNHPAIILPIGYSLMGNLLVLRTEPGEELGWILLKIQDSDDYFVLAKSLDDFFGRLEVNPDI